MDIYISKSSAILLIFWLLYVFFLEKENMHRFKRIYLVTSVVVAFVIPLLSITEYVYVEPLKSFKFNNEYFPFELNEPLEIIETPFWTLKRILWSIYLLGVVVFGFRFIKNLFSIVKTIQTNEKQKQSSITFVLLKKLINPYTFFSFIFLNKLKFQKNEVPKEVLLHEEIHAKQKHSLDILFIEIMQIVFWFQPFIWLFKKHIKLNHEFLSDQAVIDAGFKPSTYQNTLLNYSSHQDYSLANAIDYSSIKKRFTVMKTKTSQQKKWALRLLVLPLFGLIFYSFSNRKIVEVELENPEIQETELDKSIKEELRKAASMDLYYVDNYKPAVILIENKNELLLNGKKTSLEQLKTDFLNLEKVSKKEIIIDSNESVDIKFFDLVADQFDIKGLIISGSKDINITSQGEPIINYTNLTNINVSVTNLNEVNTDGASKALMEEYKAFIKKYNETKIIYGDAYERAIIIYDQLMNQAQRASVEKYPPRLIPKPNLAKVTPRKISKSLFENLKNADKCAIWIDKKHVSNSELNNYNVNDFLHYTGSKVFKNARSKKFPQPNQYRLFTKQGFKNTYQDSQLRRYNKAAKTYSNAIQEYLKGNQTDNSELIILKTKAEDIYNRFSSQDIKNLKIKPVPPVPAEYPSPRNVNQQNPSTAKEIADYNTWAKEFSNKINKAKSSKYTDHPIIKQKDLIRYKSIYSRMTEKQKEDAEVFPNIPPPPPPPPARVKPYKNSNKKTLTEIIKETPKNAKSGYEVLDNGESHYFIIYDGRKTYYNKDGYITDDKGNILPPPPPAPPAPKKADKSKGGPNANNYALFDTTSDAKAGYIKKYKQYEALRHAKPHFLRKSKADRKLMSDLWLKLRQIHIYALTKSEKSGLQMPISPALPYIKINFDGKSYYKVRSQLTEQELKTTISLSNSNRISETEDLLDENDPIVIHLENYELENKEKSENNTTKRQVFITVSEDGIYQINEDNTLKNFNPLTLSTLENLLSKLSKKDIDNTFIFTNTKDYKKFRNKPSASPEYQDDIEVSIITDDIRFPVMKFDGKFIENISYKSALDNKPSEAMKSHVRRLGKLFKKYGIKNLTL